MSSSRYGLPAKACHAGLGKECQVKPAMEVGGACLSHLVTRQENPRRRCWATRSATTSTRTVRRVRRPRGAGRRRRRAAGGPTPSSPPTSTRSPSACCALGIDKGDRVGIWAPNCAEWTLVQYATAQDRRDPGQHQPGLPHPRARVRAQPVRHPHARRRRVVQDHRLRRDDRRGARRAARRCEHVVLLGSADWDALLRRRRRRRTAERAGRRAGAARRRRPDQHPVHLGHHRLPQGRHAVATTTSSTTATSSASCAATPRPTGSASRCRSTTASAWSWATSARTTHGACMVIPAPASTRRATLRAVQAERCTSLYGVPTMFIAELADRRTSPPTTCPACAPGSWPARRARSR